MVYESLLSFYLFDEIFSINLCISWSDCFVALLFVLFLILCSLIGLLLGYFCLLNRAFIPKIVFGAHVNIDEDFKGGWFSVSIIVSASVPSLLELTFGFFV